MQFLNIIDIRYFIIIQISWKWNLHPNQHLEMKLNIFYLKKIYIAQLNCEIIFHFSNLFLMSEYQFKKIKLCNSILI